jgi:hypothetical protein
VIRNDLPELFEIFDFADPHATTGARPQTLVPTQALFMLNSDLIMETAAKLAEQLLSQVHAEETEQQGQQLPTVTTTEIAMRVLQQVLQTTPSHSEIAVIADFIDRHQAEPIHAGDSKDPRVNAVTLAFQAALASSQFQFLD